MQEPEGAKVLQELLGHGGALLEPIDKGIHVDIANGVDGDRHEEHRDQSDDDEQQDIGGDGCQRPWETETPFKEVDDGEEEKRQDGGQDDGPKEPSRQ